MDVILKGNQKLKGAINGITSKSDAHRILICAALCDKPTKILIRNLNEDLKATIACLKGMGAEITFENETVTVTPQGFAKEANLPCGESGSTLRFLLPVTGAVNQISHITGAGRLPNRPLSPLKEEMIAHGITFTAEAGNANLPLTITGTLQGGTFPLPGNISSQYITGLLLALPLLNQDSEIVLTSPLESAGYVAMTLGTLKDFSIKIEVSDKGYKIPGKQKYISPHYIEAENDWSNSAFWLGAGALGSEITVCGLVDDSFQSDRAVIDILKNYGANITQRGKDFTVTSKLPLKPIIMDAGNCPDLVPIMAVTACSVVGETNIIHAERLRLKESDRLETVAELINNLGGKCRVNDDGLTIYGTGALKGGTVNSHNDHRIAMSGAIASTICENDVIILGAEAVNKSYPDFFKHFSMLGGTYHVI